MGKELIASNEGEKRIPPHPEGPFEARCIDIIDRGMITTVYAGKEKVQHKITLRFFCGEWFKDDDGEKHPLWVDAWMTLSMFETANLRKFIGNWRGKSINDDEAKRFNVMVLLGQPALIQVIHREHNGKTYANIGSIMRLKNADDAPQAPEGYVRVEDRPPREQEGDGYAGATSARGPIEDDDLPF